MFVFGKNVIYEALNTEHKINMLFLRDDVFMHDKGIVDIAKKKAIPLTVLSKEKMNDRFKGLNQGYGADIAPFPLYQLEEVIDHHKKQFFVILDKLNDPNNLGAIIRSCDAFGVSGIIIPKKNSINITETVVKVSTGAIFYVPIIVVSNLNQAIMKLKQNNFWIVGTDAKADKNVYEVKNDCNLALVIGSEGFGISQLVSKNCDYLVKIPMVGHVNSLNASVSAGIMISALMNNKAR